ncbi:low-density lipoprotein receptor-related protein 2-like [Mya arenaria]|uniref:low-density lipoprotein receptor-related protein 2-like n=1 Tax=Mya arenaria TaxID=6604 RepID=UPI0022E5A34F|nr:low-density lipoprotein receptor-related protein 2-like [Mya arenaria]XP_052818652.1 low-density lipoprotein receptor-related protein 2-like [Mya arenaria]XP_052818653.1 low-density lipoprotein receptor-related protein 2-like [Mya arenaria]XP_052818654.1 low-density lipoprotein receptor-related protein 2-like [Mya arenaria]
MRPKTMQVPARKCLTAVLLVSCWTLTAGQVTSTTKAPTVTTTAAGDPNATVYPKERGLIFTTYDDYSSDFAHLRHLPMMPGYQNWSGGVPGVAFTNIYIKFLSIDVDFHEKMVYMYDEHYKSLVYGTNFNAELELDNMTFDFAHIGVSKGQVQIAVDWLSHTVYWTDSIYRWICAAAGQMEKINDDIYTILVDQGLEAPAGIALHPMEGIMFWSDSGKHPKIERGDMTGKNRHTIVSNNLLAPKTLEVDTVARRLFWIDRDKSTIESVTFDGTDRQTLRRIPYGLLWDLAIYKDIVVVTDVSYGDTMFYNTTIGVHYGKEEATSISIYPEYIYAVAAYFEEDQPLKQVDHCAILDCEHLCLTNQMSAVCTCAEGFEVDPASSNKCKENKGLFHRAMVLVSHTHICLADIRVSANAYYDSPCVFTVIRSIPSNQTTTPSSRRRRQVTDGTNVTSPAPTQKTSPPTVNTTTQAPPTTTTPAPTAAPGDFIQHVEVDSIGRAFYYSDASNRIYKRPVDLNINDTAKELVTYAVGEVTGLAFDWFDNNLYWSESRGQIWLVNTEDGGTETVRETNDMPANLMVLPHERALVWTSGSSIKKMAMDGTGTIMTLNSEAANPKALSVDYDKKLIYWVNEDDELYEMKTDGSLAHRVKQLSTNTFAIAVHKSYIKWIHEFADQPEKILYTAVPVTTLRGDNEEGYFNVPAIDIKILDATLQVRETDLCAHLNGGCEQICLTHFTNDKFTKKCACTTGFRLTADGTGCTSDTLTSNFALVSDRTFHAIHQIDLNTGNVNSIPFEDLGDPLGVMYDHKRKKIIYSKYQQEIIFMANLNGTGEEEIAETEWAEAVRFDLCETTGNIYYTSTYWQQIGMVSPSGHHFVLDDDFYFEELGSIAVAPSKGWLFFTADDYYFGESYIGRSNMDGTQYKALITTENGEHVVAPDGLCIDYIHEQFFWSDRVTNIIQSCNFEGTVCETKVNLTGQHAEIRDIATDGTFLYYIDTTKEHVVVFNLDTNTIEKELGKSLGRLESLDVFKSNNMNTQGTSAGCKARNGLGDCSTICVPTSGTKGRVCMCEEGEYLNDDERTCSNVYQCNEFIMQDDGVEVTFDYDTCLRHFGDECDIICPINYVPTSTAISKQKCLNSGWANETAVLCEEIRCPAVVPNAQLNTCNRYPGNRCEYTCTNGYKAAFDHAVCLNTGKWNIDVNNFCKLPQCPMTLMNGLAQIAANCDVSAGKLCKYTCADGYTLNSKLPSLTCGVNGQWVVKSDQPCILKTCPENALRYGNTTNCNTRSVGTPCKYTCNSGYKALPNLDEVICRKDLTWHPQNACQEAKCDMSFGSVTIQKDCDLKINSKCGYSCSSSFEKHSNVTMLTCRADGTWNQTNVCLEASNVAVTDAQTGSGGAISQAGATAGIVILVVIIVALVLVIAFVFFRKRKSSEVPYSTASFHNKGDVAIENPGYQATPSATPTPDRRGYGVDDHTYSTVDASQMQPVKFDRLPNSPGSGGAKDDGFVNPMYHNNQPGSEQLAETAQIDITMDGDDGVLTKDSWLKEQQKSY